MTPGARVAAAIEVLDTYLQGAPAEKALTNWARRSRFAGSKDRAAIRDIVFDVLRRRRSLTARAGEVSGRGLASAHSVEEQGPAGAAGLFDGVGHAPAPLTDAELSQLNRELPADDPAQFDLPDWLVSAFKEDFGDEALRVASALKHRAPVFLRVNLARLSRQEAAERLRADGIETVPHPEVETALQVTTNPRRVAQSAPYLAGEVELQDAASQAACAGLPAAARMLDYCAGGGGKVLAYGALQEAALFAHDANPARLRDLPERARRAQCKVKVLDTAGCKQSAPFDLVLVDAPCSGSGTWRRTPEAKWSLTPDGLTALIKLQAQIMDEAAALVAKGGHFAYATCSVLRRENRDQVAAFLSRHTDFQSSETCYWLPGPTGDGFYIAYLTRL